MGSDATFTIRLKNADSATIDAKLTDASGKVYYVRGVATDYGTEQDFTFTIPVVDGKQSGTWTLEGLYLTNVYGGTNNTMFTGPTANGPDTSTDDKPLYTVTENYYARWWAWGVDAVTAEGEGAPTVTVGSDMQIAFTNSDANANKNFGKDAAGTVTGQFGASYALSDLQLQVMAGGKPLSEYGMTLTSVKLEYRYDQNSFTKVNNTTSKNTYGGYNVATSDIASMIAGDRGTILYTVGAGADGVYALTTTNSGLSVAGRYAPYSMQLTITSSKGEETVITASAALLSTAPVYTVWSQKPTATVTGVSKSPTYQEKITYTGGTCSDSAPDFSEAADTSTPVSGIYASENKAILYADADPDNSTQHNGNYILPQLTVTIAGVSSDSTVSFILPANGKASAITFSRTGNGTITKEVGSKASIKTWTTLVVFTHTQYAYYGHGNQTITQLTVVKDGITLTFELDQPMIIVNPSSVNQ